METKQELQDKVNQAISEIQAKRLRLKSFPLFKRTSERSTLKAEIRELVKVKRSNGKILTAMKKAEKLPPPIDPSTLPPKAPKESLKLTKKGKPRKPWIQRHERRNETKPYLLGITFTEAQKTYLDIESEKQNIKAAELIRNLLVDKMSNV